MMKLTTLFAVSVSLILSGFVHLEFRLILFRKTVVGARFLLELTILITIGICLMSI